MRPLLYLEIRQFINSIKNTLRNPKRLIPVLIMAAWVTSWFVQAILSAMGAPIPRASYNVSLSGQQFELVHAVVFIVMVIGSMAVMYSAFTSGLLVFSIAHIDFMFPTPINRRSVLLIKLVKDYMKFGFWVAFLAVFITSTSTDLRNRWLTTDGMLGLGAVFALLLLVVNIAHTINIVFTFGFERLKQTGLVIKGILLVGVASAVGAGIYQYVVTGNTFASILWAVDSPVVNFVFAPAKWAATLFLAPFYGVTSEGYLQFVLLWILAAASFALLLSRKENVYEPSLGISVKYAKRRQAMQSGDYSRIRIDEMMEKGTRRLGGLPIPAFGQGAAALVWKNLLTKYRVSRTQLILMAILPIVIIFSIRRMISDARVLQNMPLLLLYSTYILSLMSQVEFRAELRHANILKAAPIPAWKAMLAQVITGTIYLAAGITILAAAMWFVIPETRGSLLIMCMVSAPFIGFATISAATIPSLLYPDTRDAAQNYICNMLGFFLVSIAAIPTIVLGGTLLGLTDVPEWIIVLTVSVANVIVGASGVSIAGSIFCRFDPTSE